MPHNLGNMFFSKSFGYAVRGVLYIALMQDEKHYVQVEEIASKLVAPKHFMGKILKKLVKENILLSVKGPSGGFTLTRETLELPVMKLAVLTDGVDFFDKCVLRVKECDTDNPCPLHYQVVEIRNKLKNVLSSTKIGDLLKENKADFIKSLSAANVTSILAAGKEEIY